MNKLISVMGASGVGKTAFVQGFGRALGVEADSVRDQAVAGIPSGRFTTAREVATLVTVLASRRTANVNGSNFIIDGGLIKTM